MEVRAEAESPDYRLETDVLVVGAGAAGIRAATTASDAGAKVLLASRKPIGKGGSTFYPLSLPWGMVYAESGAEDERAFLAELEAAGAGFQDEALSKLMVERSRGAYDYLRGIGVELEDLSAAGDVPCFGTRPRGARLKDPEAAARSFAAQVVERDIDCLDGARLFDLVVEEDRCLGALGLDSAGRIFSVEAGALILATGGAEGLWYEGFSSGDTEGEGYAMAARAGARLVNLEFIQFIPGLVSPIRGVNFHHKSLASLPSILGLRGEDRLAPFLPPGLGEADCLLARSQHGPFSCEDESRYFDLALCAADPFSGLTVAYNADFFGDAAYAPWRGYLASIGVDAARDRLAIYPHCQGFNGGILIDEDCRTDVEGLYACGECAGGVHGADRVGGAAILAALVFGAVAGEEAARASLARRGKRIPLKRLPALPAPEGAAQLRELAASILQGQASIERRAEGLEGGLAELERAAEAAPRGGAPEGSRAQGALARNACTAARLILGSMLARRESRGPHYRADWDPRSGRPARGRRNTIGIDRDGKLLIGELAAPVRHPQLHAKEGST
jgi:fumarate reductase (CoM/CoB) subunit A